MTFTLFQGQRTCSGMRAHGVQSVLRVDAAAVSVTNPCCGLLES
jgi:hypothetical protein